ncbi:unnamed protein product [Closterium sp. NIES-54]
MGCRPTLCISSNTSAASLTAPGGRTGKKGTGGRERKQQLTKAVAGKQRNESSVGLHAWPDTRPLQLQHQLHCLPAPQLLLLTRLPLPNPGPLLPPPLPLLLLFLLPSLLPSLLSSFRSSLLSSLRPSASQQSQLSVQLSVHAAMGLHQPGHRAVIRGQPRSQHAFEHCHRLVCAPIQAEGG